jgi:hypothetical protein
MKLYEPAGDLNDYINEYDQIHSMIRVARDARGITDDRARDNLGTITLLELEAALEKYRVRTVGERYFSKDSRQAITEDRAMIEEIKKNPEKVARLNQMAALVNNHPDVETYKRAFNEVWRILRGKDAPRYGFTDPASDPDLLPPPV